MAQASSHAWCYTGPAPDTTGVFHWTIDNFMERINGTSTKTLNSDSFCIKEEEYMLKLYPKGHNEAAEGYVRYGCTQIIVCIFTITIFSAFLELQKSGSSSSFNKKEVFVSFHIDVTSGSNKVTQIQIDLMKL